MVLMKGASCWILGNGFNLLKTWQINLQLTPWADLSHYGTTFRIKGWKYVWGLIFNKNTLSISWGPSGAKTSPASSRPLHRLRCDITEQVETSLMGLTCDQMAKNLQGILTSCAPDSQSVISDPNVVISCAGFWWQITPEFIVMVINRQVETPQFFQEVTVIPGFHGL